MKMLAILALAALLAGCDLINPADPGSGYYSETAGPGCQPVQVAGGPPDTLNPGAAKYYPQVVVTLYFCPAK